MAPTFAPYSLTLLDHLILHGYVACMFTFDLKGVSPATAVESLQNATSRLLLYFPFLGGCVVPHLIRDEGGGKTKTFEVRYHEEMARTFFSVKQHPASTASLVEGRLNPTFYPHVLSSRPQDPCPVYRLQANIVADSLFLVAYFQHMVMDGLGGTVVFQALAQLCRDPATSTFDFPTDPRHQQQMREHIAQLAISAAPKPLDWEPKPSTFVQLDSTDPRNATVNRRYQIPAMKIRMIQEFHQSTSTEMRTNRTGLRTGDRHLSPSLILGAIFGMCSNRARNAAGQGGWYSPNLIITTDIRKQLSLPSTYIGNALVNVVIPLEETNIPLPRTRYGPRRSDMVLDDLNRLCRIACAAHRELARYDFEHTRAMLATLETSKNRGSIGLACDGLIFSDAHRMDIYQDLGPLGEVQDFALPGNNVSGFCWMLPIRAPETPRRDLEHYEIQIGLEMAAMAELERDELFLWLTHGSLPKASL